MRRRFAAKHSPAALFESLEPRALFAAVPTVAWTGPQREIDSVVIGDVNNDGIADTVIASGHDIQLLLGNGDATFQNPRTTTIPGNVGHIALGRFDGDDTLDLVSVGYGNGTSNGEVFARALVFDSGLETFRLISRRPLRMPSFPTSEQGIAQVTQVSVGDLTPDGRDDVAVVVRVDQAGVPVMSRVHIFSVVNGQLVNSGVDGGPSISTPARVLTGDVQSIAALSLEAGQPQRLYLGVEHPSPLRTVLVTLDRAGDGWHVAPVRAFERTNVVQITAHDIDADGHSDLTVTTAPFTSFNVQRNGFVYVLRRGSGGSPSAWTTYGGAMPFAQSTLTSQSYSLQVMDVGDYDHDGFNDMLVLKRQDLSGYFSNGRDTGENEQSELTVVSTNPAISNRTVWSGFYYHTFYYAGYESSGGQRFPAFLGAGTLVTGANEPGLVGVLGTSVYVFGTIPV